MEGETAVDQLTRAALRQLPAVYELVDALPPDQRDSLDEQYITDCARFAIDSARAEILSGNPDAAKTVRQRFAAELDILRCEGVKVVINGTGVVVHTNLGRSPVSEATAQAMSEAATHYLPLEVELETGARGGRGREVSALLRALTGAQRSLVVNNNAAGILLTLSALCAGRKVIVSRGQAVEIGGGFRIPDVMRQSGAILVEVGTTNRTRLSDYEQAIDEETAAILSVHASNFEITGFTEKPELAELAELAHACGLLLIEDVGSGCLVQTERYGLAHEPTLAESVAAGVDVVTASGDKLLGGPQAGLVLGTEQAVAKIARHPLARAVRVDKTVQAGIAATLRHYLRGEQDQQVPIWRMISQSPEELARRVDRWLAEIGDPRCERVATTSVIGGGSLPGKSQPSAGLAISIESIGAAEAARRLRVGEPAVFPRIIDERAVIDARTVLPDQDAGVVEAVRRLLAGS